MNRAASYTVLELRDRGKKDIPGDMVSSSHLIYSSPATLSFNSPGAEGFGVKRAGLSVPGSVMLIVSPGCCGRNTSSISTMPGYENRFFYLTMDETDLVTGRHLRRIPKAVCEIRESLSVRPSVIMICITCVDALLGTDMERVCKKAEEMVNRGNPESCFIKVRPCYMYALTREGRKPPMVHVRQSIYSMLEPMKKRADSVNLMGYFAPVDPKSELRDLLHGIGVKTIREVSSCGSFDAFLRMAEANFNVVLNPEARPAARDLQERLGIPSIELMRLYQIDRIAAQYDALGAVLGTKLEYEPYREKARASMKRFREAFPNAVFSIGEAVNADPFELALALVRYGFAVKEIFGTLTTDSYRYIRHLAELSPGTRVYSNLSPTMLLYKEPPAEDGDAFPIALGRDAGWYHPDIPCLEWGQDIQPFGFTGAADFFDALLMTAQGRQKGVFSSDIRLGKQEAAESRIMRLSGTKERKADTSPAVMPPKGFRKILTPFAPDQSGAVSVLYELGGITVICDAGGCTGNICGFDEPRWFTDRSAVFSAGLRDMDAILGRDDRLVEKLAQTGELLEKSENTPGFAAIIGTPVPAVIGTDFRALEKMAEKKTGLPCIGIPCDGMEYYDKGVERVYLALLDKFAPKQAAEADSTEADSIGILGAQYMDLSGIADHAGLKALVEKSSGKRAVVFGSGQDGIKAFSDIGRISRNIVVSVSGYEAAMRLKRQYGIPFECRNPAVEDWLERMLSGTDVRGKRILVIHEQIAAASCRKVLLEHGASRTDTASWFMLKDALAEEGDMRFREESEAAAAVRAGGYDMVIADPVIIPLIRDYFDGLFVGLAHFAVSGGSRYTESAAGSEQSGL